MTVTLPRYPAQGEVLRSIVLEYCSSRYLGTAVRFVLVHSHPRTSSAQQLHRRRPVCGFASKQADLDDLNPLLRPAHTFERPNCPARCCKSLDSVQLARWTLPATLSACVCLNRITFFFLNFVPHRSATAIGTRECTADASSMLADCSSSSCSHGAGSLAATGAQLGSDRPAAATVGTKPGLRCSASLRLSSCRWPCSMLQVTD